MALTHLERLHLNPGRARSVTAFLESYANTTERELINLQDERDEIEGSGYGAYTSERGDVRWTLTMEMASTLREAASWAAYFDIDRSVRLLRRAGALYQRAGLAFGSFLLTIAGAPPVNELPRDIAFMATLSGQAGPTDTSEVPAALYHPQQQVYMLLACAGMADTLANYQQQIRGANEVVDVRGALHAIAAGSPNRVGVLPFGALGTPVRVPWDIGLHLLEKSNPESLDIVAQHLSGLCRRYAEIMGLARVNDHLWEHAAAPVDVGDIELMGITALSIRHFGHGDIIEAVIRHGLNPDDISFIPIDLGSEMAEPSTEPPIQAG